MPLKNRNPSFLQLNPFFFLLNPIRGFTIIFHRHWYTSLSKHTYINRYTTISPHSHTHTHPFSLFSLSLWKWTSSPNLRFSAMLNKTTTTSKHGHYYNFIHEFQLISMFPVFFPSVFPSTSLQCTMLLFFFFLFDCYLSVCLYYYDDFRMTRKRVFIPRNVVCGTFSRDFRGR